ncbi:MAG: hypothetical protein V4596_05915 [Bdellovibrionota bacterium]
MNKKLEQLKYIILPGKFPNDPIAQDLHNKSFLYWKNFWNKIFEEKKLNHQVLADNLWRQDLIGLIINDNEIVGQIFYSFFNLKSLTSNNHSYLINNYTEDFFARLKEQGITNFMTMESIGIAPHWRKNQSGVPMSAVIFSLACEHLKQFENEVLIGAARKNSVVPSVLKQLGAEALITDIDLYDEPAELIAIFRKNIKVYPDSAVPLLSKKLWNQRQDLSQDTPMLKVKKKSAA